MAIDHAHSAQGDMSFGLVLVTANERCSATWLQLKGFIFLSPCRTCNLEVARKEGLMQLPLLEEKRVGGRVRRYVQYVLSTTPLAPFVRVSTPWLGKRHAC